MGNNNNEDDDSCESVGLENKLELRGRLDAKSVPALARWLSPDPKAVRKVARVELAELKSRVGGVLDCPLRRPVLYWADDNARLNSVRVVRHKNLLAHPANPVVRVFINHHYEGNDMPDHVWRALRLSHKNFSLKYPEQVQEIEFSCQLSEVAAVIGIVPEFIEARHIGGPYPPPPVPLRDDSANGWDNPRAKYFWSTAAFSADQIEYFRRNPKYKPPPEEHDGPHNDLPDPFSGPSTDSQ